MSQLPPAYGNKNSSPLLSIFSVRDIFKMNDPARQACAGENWTRAQALSPPQARVSIPRARTRCSAWTKSPAGSSAHAEPRAKILEMLTALGQIRKVNDRYVI